MTTITIERPGAEHVARARRNDSKIGARSGPRLLGMVFAGGVAFLVLTATLVALRVGYRVYREC